MACRLAGVKPYLNQCWNIVNCTLREKQPVKSASQFIYFNSENAIENVVSEKAAILPRPQCVKINVGEQYGNICNMHELSMLLHNFG